MQKGLLVSRSLNANAETCFFISGATGQIRASERAEDDECHLTLVEEEARLMIRL